MKAIWLNPVATGSTSLDVRINPHDVDWLGHNKILESQGYEVYLHEPFVLKKKWSSYQPKLFTSDLPNFKADLVLLSVSPFIGDYGGWKYHEEIKKGTSRSKNLDDVCDFLDSHDGDIHIFIDDPRPAFQAVFLKEPKKHHRIFDHINRAKLVVADPMFLKEELRDRAIVSDYWRFVSVGEPKSFRKETDFFCVYPGLKTQRRPRVKQIEAWMGNTPGCYTVGEIKVGNIQSLSNFTKVSLEEVLDLTCRSTTAVITGEPEHTWLTPRVIQSLCQGTICSIHPDFPGRHHFPDDILQDQTFAAAEQFDYRLLTEEIYQRQLDFVRDLRNGR